MYGSGSGYSDSRRFVPRFDVVDHGLQVGRQRRVEVDPAAVAGWVNDSRAECRNGRSSRITARRSVGDAAVHAAVHRVADDRMADGVEVHADLMRAAGRDRHLQQRHARKVPRPGHPRHGAAGAPRPRRHLLPLLRVAADRLVDPLARLDHAPHQRDVLLLDLAIVELPRQLLVRAVVLRHDHQPGRAAIEPMDDARPQLAADAAQILDVVQQRVHQRARAVARRRMHDHARRLVEHDDVGVLVDDEERQRLRLRPSPATGSGTSIAKVWSVCTAVLGADLRDRARGPGLP